MEKKYYQIKKVYLAQAMAYLGFTYYKDGFGGDTIYKFEDTNKFRMALTGLTNLKYRVNQFIE